MELAITNFRYGTLKNDCSVRGPAEAIGIVNPALILSNSPACGVRILATEPERTMSGMSASASMTRGTFACSTISVINACVSTSRPHPRTDKQGRGLIDSSIKQMLPFKGQAAIGSNRPADPHYFGESGSIGRY